MNDSVKTRIYQRIGAFLFRRHQDEIAADARKRYRPKLGPGEDVTDEWFEDKLQPRCIMCSADHFIPVPGKIPACYHGCMGENGDPLHLIGYYTEPIPEPKRETKT